MNHKSIRFGSRFLGIDSRFLIAILCFIIVGCQPGSEVEEVSDELVLRTPDPLAMLLVGGDTGLADTISRQWSAQRDGELTTRTQSLQAFMDSDYEIDAGVDVMLYPPGLLGDLESRGQLQLIPKWLWNSEELNKNEFLRHHRKTLVRHGNQTWAVPLGSPQFMLIYNIDSFSQLGLEPPKSWKEFVELAEEIRDHGDLQDDDGEPLPTEIEFPLGGGWAGQIFLARVGPSIRNRGKLSTVFDRKTMKPLIEAPPFVEALAELKSLVGESELQLALGPSQVYERLLRGESAVGVSWPSKKFSETMDADEVSANIAIAPVPGSDQWFDFQSGKWTVRAADDSNNIELIGFSGLIASVPQSSRNTQAAFEFLQWLGSKSVNLMTVAECSDSGPFRASHLGDPARWTGTQISDQASQQFADAIRQSDDQDVVFMFPRIPGREQYLRALDQSVRECLQGKLDPEEALQRVATEWESITEQQGRSQQLSELRKDAAL